MDPLTFYTVGLARQQEMLREAENERLARLLRTDQSPLSRLRAWVSARIASASPGSTPAPCPEIVADCP